MIDYAKIIEQKRGLARDLRKLASKSGEEAARWLQSQDGRTRRRAARAAMTAIHYYHLAETFDGTADTLEQQVAERLES